MAHADVAVVILAAGAGRRLGLGPKAHVTLGDATFLERVASVCARAGCGPLYVVGSPEDPRIASASAACGASLLVNPDPSRGMSSSVHVGLGAVSGSAIVFPVDFPAVTAATVHALASAIDDASWVRPVFEGKGGHPVAIGAALIPRILACGATTPLRDALQRVGAGLEVPCDDVGVVTDVDVPADLLQVRALLARR